MDDKFFSIEHEPALQDGHAESDPSEHRAAPLQRHPDEVEALRDSIAAEPALPQHRDPRPWKLWLEEKRRQCTLPGNLAVTVLAAVLGGPLAIVGALMAGQQGATRYVYVIVFGPVIEELLKQSGMTYLLEKKPYRIFAAWQFVFAGLVSGLVFAAIENCVYIGYYASAMGVADIDALAAFRWIACSSLHVVCATIASLGLVRVWKKQVEDGQPADLAAAFPCFAVAMVVHGVYNLGAVFVKF